MTDRELRKLKRSLEKLPTVFEAACAVLNGEVKLPRRAPGPGEEASRLSPPLRTHPPRWGRRLIPPEFLSYLRPFTEEEEEWAEEQEELQRHSSREDMNAARAAVVAGIRLLTPPKGLPASYKWGSSEPDSIANYVLPDVLKQWPPAISAARLEDGLSILGPSLSIVARSLRDADWQAMALGMRLFAAHTEAPVRYYRSLAAVVYLQFGFRLGQHQQRPDREIRPCLACPRFFVARSQKALTCSPACRVRLSRRTRPDWKEARERDRKRKERARGPKAASRTSKPPSVRKKRRPR